MVHHAAWFDLLLRLRQSAPRREAARLIAVSQPYAGAFLNAVPKYHAFQIASPLLRIAAPDPLGGGPPDGLPWLAPPALSF